MPETHAVAVIGGATAGAEAAAILAEQGILVVVFEQNPRPYGKIEDGLPRWHTALRNKEYGTIDQKLTREHVHFVPCTTVGRDVELSALANEWGFHSIVLANGAWNDRSLPIEGADSFVGKGLVYQNPFIQFFNHNHEKGYSGETFPILDGTIVVGGGLASIDVVKVIMLELTLTALAERGIEQDLVELEVKGIPKTLGGHGLRWEDLGIDGTTLYYRRRPEDMPLISAPDGADAARLAKVAKSRTRVLEKAMSKYLFKIEPLAAPEALLVEEDRLVGLVFARTKLEDGRVVKTDERFEARGPQVISSIGSTPAPLAGIPMNGELYAFQDWDFGRLAEFPTLFSAGNVVTGKGNIVDSRKHAKRVAEYMRDEYFQLATQVRTLPPLSGEAVEALMKNVRSQQERAGYDGDYRTWIDSVTPTVA